MLFVDVVGYTALSEHADVEDVSDAMNALWSRLDQEVLDHGGKVDKHIGDALMAVWGTHRGREDDAEQAVRCALAMQTHLQDFADRVAELSPQAPRPRLRIGINTGPALVTPVGLAGETTRMGDAVNTASRIEKSAEPGEVLIGRDTYRLVRGVFTVREREPVRVKGKAEPLETYVVEALRPRAFRLRTRGLEGVEARMVGRGEQLAELCRATDVSREAGELQVRVVEGEAGVGKVARDAESGLLGGRRSPDPCWWSGAGSNRRHHDFQSCALPTELPDRGPARHPDQPLRGGPGTLVPGEAGHEMLLTSSERT